MPVLRSALFLPLLVLWTLLLAPAAPVLALMKSPARVRAYARFWARGVLGLLRVVGGLGCREQGQGNRPAGPALYIANHQSAWETIAFAVLVPDVAIVLKEELYRIPVFGWFLRNSPMIAIDRAGGASALKKMLREAREAAGEGRSLLIFPEGTRRGPAERAEFQRGVVMLYKALGLPAVPVAHNAGLYWKGKSFEVKPGTVRVSYLPALPPGLPDAEFLGRVTTAIYEERDRLVAVAESER